MQGFYQHVEVGGVWKSGEGTVLPEYFMTFSFPGCLTWFILRVQPEKKVPMK